MQKQNEAKTLARIYFLDSPKVRESPLIHDSPKWILRYAQYDGVVIRHCEAIQRIAEAIQITRKPKFDIINP